MVYSELVKKACLISFEAHKTDPDKGGYPYVYHPFFLATQMDDEVTACVALLHDVVEDHGDIYSFVTLREAGFPDEVVDALKLLTHGDGVPYPDYIRALAKNPVAAAVKMADLRHNLDARRTGGVKPKKYETYLQAVKELESFQSPENRLKE